MSSLLILPALLAALASPAPDAARSAEGPAPSPYAGQRLESLGNVTPRLAERILKNRSNLPSSTEEEAWIKGLPPEIIGEANLRYAEPQGVDPRLTSLDVFRLRMPKGKAPIVIFVHGGGMSAGDKSPAALVENKARYFPSHGFMFVSANYRLAPEVRHPVATQDVAAAIAYVRRHAEAWGGDPDELFIIGHSAGAEIVDQIVLQESFLTGAGVPASSIRGVVSVDPSLYDIGFAMAHDGGDWLVPDLIKMVYGSSPDEWKEASPVTYLIPGRRLPPMLLFCAVDPSSLSNRETQLFAARLREVGGDVAVQDAREKDHSHLGRDIGNPGDWITAMVMDFIHRNMSSSSALRK